MTLPLVGQGTDASISIYNLRRDTEPVPAFKLCYLYKFDVGFIIIGNILTRDGLKECLRMLVSVFLAIFDLTGAVLSHFGGQGVQIPEIAGCNDVSRKNRYFRENH